MATIRAEVDFEVKDKVYSILEPNDSFSVRAIVLREGEPTYLCFNPEYGEVEFQSNEITSERSIY